VDVFICGHEMLSAAGGGSKESFARLLSAGTQETHGSNYALHPEAEKRLQKLDDMDDARSLREQDRAGQILAATALLLKARIFDRHVQRNSNLDVKNSILIDRTRCGAIVATSRGATELIEKSVSQFQTNQRVAPKTSPLTSAGIFASLVSQLLEIEGGHFTLSSTCTSSMNAIGVAYHLLNSGLFEHCVAGGCEAPLTPLTAAMMKAAKVVAPKHITRVSSMGADDKGMILGEGAGLVFLSVKPTTTTTARIAAFAMASENTGLTGISADGQALQRAMEKALRTAGWSANDLDLIVPHGSGTQKGDHAEALAYETIFSAEGFKLPPLLPCKWLTGHTLGAAGVHALCFALEALENNILPLPPYPLLEGLHAKRRSSLLKRVMICGLGFGGGASCLLIEKI
jgi:3-oxoacyl-(acyl-carrier-protein) synthase